MLHKIIWWNFYIFTFTFCDDHVLLSYIIVPDMESRDHEVVVVGRTMNLGTGNLEWGGNGEGLRKGRSVHELTWDQGGRDPITARKVFQVSRRE
jgi:hypothetical protein